MVLLKVDVTRKLVPVLATQDGMVTPAAKVSLNYTTNSSSQFFHVMVANLLQSMFANYCLELT